MYVTYLKKVNPSLYRPGQAFRFPGGLSSQISRQSAHDGGKIVRHKHRPPLLPRWYSWYPFLSEAESTPKPLWGQKNYVNEHSNDTIGNRNRDLPACSANAWPLTCMYLHVICWQANFKRCGYPCYKVPNIDGVVKQRTRGISLLKLIQAPCSTQLTSVFASLNTWHLLPVLQHRV